MTFGELFAGIGGFSLGLERAGMTCKWQVEIDPYATAVLRKHWPDVPKHDDVRTFPPHTHTHTHDYSVDLICGGFPCQDISVAGKGAGLAGERSGLWYEFARIISELRPRYIIVENVAALLTRGMDVVLGTLSTLGYDAEWHVIPASAVGAPHRRDRVWIVGVRRWDGEQADASCADANGFGSHRAKININGSAELRHEQERFAGPLGEDVSDADSGRLHRIDADAGDGGTIQAEGTQREFCGSGCGGDVADSVSQRDALRRDGQALPTAVAGRNGNAGGGERDSGPRRAGRAGQGSGDVADAEGVSGWSGLCEGRQQQDGNQSGDRCGDVSDANRAGRQQQRRPEPVRAEQPAAECGGWWESEPDVGRALDGFSSWLDDHKRLTRQSHERIMAYVVRTQGEGDANAKKKSAAEIMRSLRDCFGEENVQRAAGGSVCVSAAEVLLAYLRKLEEGQCEEGNASLEGQEDEGAAVRGLRPDDKPSRTSHRPRRNKQHTREYSNTLQDLSRLLALDSQAAWVAYRRSDACPRLNWESGIPRVAHGVPSRVDRLRCLGNAVVPQVVEVIGRAILEAEARMTA